MQEGMSSTCATRSLVRKIIWPPSNSRAIASVKRDVKGTLMLMLSNDEIYSLLKMDYAMRLLEKAYRAQAEGKATYRPRADMYVPSPVEGGVYAFKSMEGGMADPPVVALRLNSDVIHWENRGGTLVKDKLPRAGGQWVGLVLLFSSATGEPPGILHAALKERVRGAGPRARA